MLRAGFRLRHIAAFILFAAALAALHFEPRNVRAQDQDAEYTAEMRRAETAMTRGQFDLAQKAFKRARSLRKTSAEAHLGLARAYQALGSFKDAIDSCEDAAKYCGDDSTLQARVHNQRGLALFSSSKKPQDKQIREAEAAFRSALSLDERLAITRYNLGVALLRQGRDAEGVAELKTFVGMAGDLPEGVEAARMIDNPRRAREQVAPDFVITTLDNRQLTLEDLKGKVVLFDFWATWCGPCVKATPGLKQLQKKYKEKPFVIVGVSLDNTESPLRSYIETNQMDWPQYWDRSRVLAKLFQVKPIPTYILMDHEGVVRETQSGWSPSIDGWLDGKVRKYLQAIPQ